MSAVALALAALSLAFVASALVVARRELAALWRVAPGSPVTPVAPARQLPPLAERAGGAAEGLLVVVPARNEGARIGPTLRALLADDSAPAAIVVVDDRSTDDTAAVVEALAAQAAGRLRLLRLEDEPPPGVFGKPRALQAAVDDARARAAAEGGTLPERVLFLDADVVLAPGALAALNGAMDRSGADALSGVPRIVCESAVEQMFVPALISVVTGRFAPSRVHDDVDPTAFLNGQLVLVKTAALDDAGGWAAVSGTVLEDVALARALKSRGKRVRLADLRPWASTRMYASFAELSDGFGKNATALLGRTAGVVGVFAFATSLVPWLVAGIAVASPDPLALAACVVAVVTMGLQALVRRTAGAPVWPALVLPVVYAGVAVVLVRASLRRRIAWRGRVYDA